MAKQDLSYAQPGMTRGDEVPRGYGREEHSVELDLDFDAACEALEAFATHQLPYMFLHPSGVRVAEGADVIVCARVFGLWTLNPCRVVWVERSVGRFAYGYGTLPGHSEHGEEAFVVEQTAAGRVTAMTSAWARPQDLLARLGRPVAHRVQRQVKIDYMGAIERFARENPPA